MAGDGGRWQRVVPWIGYSVVRVAFFVVPLVIAVLFGAAIPFAAILAAIIGMCLSVLFLHRQRAALAGALERRPPKPDRDDAIEDAAVDSAQEAAAGEQGDSGQRANTSASPNA